MNRLFIFNIDRAISFLRLGSKHFLPDFSSIETENQLSYCGSTIEVLCIRIMTHPQVSGQKLTPIRSFFGLETHPFWSHMPNVTQYGSAPRMADLDKMLTGF